MCGIAGYSLHPRSSLERTLGCAGTSRRDRRARRRRRRLRLPRARRHLRDGRQAADAGLAAPRARLRARRRRPSCSSTSATTRRAIPSIAANNHPVRHGPVVGIHNGIITNDDELLAPHSCARAEPRMTVDSEAIFALAAHSRNDARALEHLRGAMATAWLDEREPGVVFLARGSGRPLWLGEGRDGVFFASTRLALEVVERYCRAAAAQARGARQGTLARARGRRGRPPRALPPRPRLRRARSAAGRARAAGARLLPDAPRGARRDLSADRAVGPRNCGIPLPESSRGRSA